MNISNLVTILLCPIFSMIMYSSDMQLPTDDDHPKYRSTQLFRIALLFHYIYCLPSINYVFCYPMFPIMQSKVFLQLFSRLAYWANHHSDDLEQLVPHANLSKYYDLNLNEGEFFNAFWFYFSHNPKVKFMVLQSKFMLKFL